MTDKYYMDYLRKKGKLKKLKLTDDQIARQMIRASGECLCPKCGQEYYSHPYVENCLDMNGYPYMHVTCDGLIVKL